MNQLKRVTPLCTDPILFSCVRVTDLRGSGSRTQINWRLSPGIEIFLLENCCNLSLKIPPSKKKIESSGTFKTNKFNFGYKLLFACNFFPLDYFFPVSDLHGYLPFFVPKGPSVRTNGLHTNRTLHFTFLHIHISVQVCNRVTFVFRICQ